MKAEIASKSKALFFLNLGIKWGWVVNARPWLLYPQERSGTHRIGGWVILRTSLDGRRKSHPNWDSIPRPSSPQHIAIPNELLHLWYWIYRCILVCKNYRQFEIQFSDFSKLTHLTVSIHSLREHQWDCLTSDTKTCLWHAALVTKKTRFLLHLMHSTKTTILQQMYCYHPTESTLTQP